MRRQPHPAIERLLDAIQERLSGLSRKERTAAVNDAEAFVAERERLSTRPESSRAQKRPKHRIRIAG
jgi:hypothetical protein